MSAVTAPPGALQRLVAWIAEPRVQRVCFFIAYLSAFAAGLVLIFTEPSLLPKVLGQTVALAWPGFLVAGGAIGAISVLPGWNSFERVAITSLLTSTALFVVFVYGLAMLSLTLQLVLYLLAITAAAALVGRMWEIRFYSIQPRVG